METVAEWIANPHDRPVLHMADIMEVMLRYDISKSAFRGRKKPSREYYNEMVQAIDSYRMDRDAYDRIVEEAMSKPRVRMIDHMDTDGDDVDVDAYASQLDEPRPKCFNVRVASRKVRKSALTLVADFAIPYGHRTATYTQKIHKEAYQIALQAEMEGRPCRVVLFSPVNYPELPDYRGIYVVKDWHEPIFPALWGAFQSNLIGNSALNVLSEIIIGTRCRGNGTPNVKNVPLQHGEEMVIVGKEHSRFIGGFEES